MARPITVSFMAGPRVLQPGLWEPRATSVPSAGSRLATAQAARGASPDREPDACESSNSGGYDQIIGNVPLTLEGTVGSSTPSVPEPSTITVLASGLGMVFFIIRSRRLRR
jgi:hypothetical protein